MKVKIELELFLTRLEQYQALAQTTGRSLEDLFQEALGQYLGANSHQLPPEADVRGLIHQVASLQTRLQVLEQRQPLISSASGGDRRENGGRGLSSPQSDIASEEEWEDEPDEILEQFLPPAF